MAMTFEFNIRPFSYGHDKITFGRMRVHSAGSKHEYMVDFKTKGSYGGWRTLHGTVPKLQPDGTKRSGHRNFLHLLADILADIDLDALGRDYVNVYAEVKEAYPNLAPGKDYPEGGGGTGPY